MNVLLISDDNALGRALSAQFALRGRNTRVLAPAQLSRLSDELLAGNMVVDTALVATLQRQVLDEAALQAVVSQRQAFYSRCGRLGVAVLMLSEGRVFDGDRDDVARPETRDLHPASEAGRQFLALEAGLEASEARSLILRGGPLVAAEGEDFLHDCVLALREGRALKLDSERLCCPTPMVDLARVVSGMVDQIACDAACEGIYHYNSGGACSAYEFAEVVYAFVSQLLSLPASEESALQSVKGGDTWQPLVPVLDCERLLHDFGIKQLPWRAFLPKLIKTLCEEAEK